MIGVTVRVNWKGNQFTRKLRGHLNQSLNDAGRYLLAAMLHDISRIQGSYSPSKHSRPGDPPYYITRKLIRSWTIDHIRPQLRLILKSDLPYARYLEQGTRIMKPRPYIRSNLLQQRAAIARIMCRPM